MNPNLISQEALAIGASVGRSFLHILPFLALSIPLAVMLKRTGVADKIRRGLGANPYLAVLMATLVGGLSPFCSCGVIPIITTLLLGGVPLAPVMAFWLASPSMDPEIFVLSVGSIGWELAIWRLTATFVMSLGGGLVTLWMEQKGWISHDSLRPSILRFPEKDLVPTTTAATAICCGGPSPIGGEPSSNRWTLSACACGSVGGDVSVASPTPGGCGSEQCADTILARDLSRETRWKGLANDAIRTATSLSGYMVMAFLLEALIIRYVPQDLIASYLGNQSPWSVPFATLISIPMYTTNLTSLGLIAGLLQRGMSGGAALAFLIGGAVTTLPAMSAVYGIVRWRVFVLYLGFCLAGSLLAGFVFQVVHAATR